MNFILIGIIILVIIVFIINQKDEISYLLDLFTFTPNKKFIDINNNNFENKLKILILSTDNRNTEYIQLHKKSFQNYSNLHNYTFLFEEPCTNLPIFFCKYQRILQLMEEYPDYDYFIWTDSDTIVNKKYLDFPLESMIEQVGNNVDFMYTDFTLRGMLPYEISSIVCKAFIGGFYVFKNNNNVKLLLKNCINYIDYSKWNNRFKGDCNYGGECYEEAALFYNVRNNKEINNVQLCGKFLYNGSFCYDDSFIIHDLSKSADCFKKLI